MKEEIQKLIYQALTKLYSQKDIPIADQEQIPVERTRNAEFGDYASSVALSLSKSFGIKPRELAAKIIENLPAHPLVTGVNIAGPGFINFFIHDNAFFSVISQVLREREHFGVQSRQSKKINIEFVSSNPTGPLHVGHGRGAAYGSVLANLLENDGFEVHREYYINDAGRQMDILAVSVWLRYLESSGQEITFPQNGYKGLYVYDIAEELKSNYHEQLIRPAETIFTNLPPDEMENGPGDKEIYIDALIERAKNLLGTVLFEEIRSLAVSSILAGIQDDLEQFGVQFQEWFSERSMKDSGAVNHAIDVLQKNGHLYNQKGALWFRSTDFGDDKDRVLVRENGQPTYFASDVAYLFNKFERGFDELIYILGADHHGYIPRLRAAAEALKIPQDILKIILVQFATLYRGEEKISMSTRSGSFITLRQLFEEVGLDAARFFYVMRKSEQHLDFDLELAKSNSRHNPVYYLQYAHARICGIFMQLHEKNGVYQPELGIAHLNLLAKPIEKKLMNFLAQYPELVHRSARDYEPHQVVTYLIELSQLMHAYYNDNVILVDDENLRQARLCLIDATRQIIRNALKILGVSAPERLQKLSEKE